MIKPLVPQEIVLITGGSLICQSDYDPFDTDQRIVSLYAPTMLVPVQMQVMTEKGPKEVTTKVLRPYIQLGDPISLVSVERQNIVMSLPVDESRADAYYSYLEALMELMEEEESLSMQVDGEENTGPTEEIDQPDIDTDDTPSVESNTDNQYDLESISAPKTKRLLH